MVVLVEYATESISSSDGELVQSVWFGDRWGEWALWRCAVQGAGVSGDRCRTLRIRTGRAGGGLVHDQGAVE
jgi:hypothetical protein